MLVAARGWSSALKAVGTTARFSLLGPFVRGQVLERLRFGVVIVGTQAVEVGAVVTTGSAVSLEAWRAGRPVFQRSEVIGDGQPVFGLRLISNVPWAFTVELGVRVVEGPAYLLWRLVVGGGLSMCDGFCSCSVLEEEGRVVGNGS